MSQSVAAFLSRTRWRASQVAAFVSVLSLGSCGTTDPDQGSAAGAGGDSTNGGSPARGGSAGNGGKGPVNVGGTESGGTDARGGAGGTVAVGGEGGTDASGGDGGAQAMGGAGGVAPDDATVRGRLMDNFGHELSNVPVQIGEAVVSTDSQGKFAIADVTGQYDVSMLLTFGNGRKYGWVFQGLTRRDPTLQVYRGLPDRSGNIVVTPSSATSSPTRTLSVALGSADGSGLLENVGPSGVQTSTSWSGPATTPATAHGLIWQFDSVTELPTSYVAYDSRPALLTENGTTNIALDLAADVIPAGTVAGTVTPASNEDRRNSVFLRFNSGASIQLVSDYDGPNTFSYMVPTVATSSVTFAASEGSSYRGAYAVVHRDGLAAGAATVTAKVPTPPSLLAPATSFENVDNATAFSFQDGSGHAGASVVWFESVNFYQGLYVVTTKKQLTVPQIVGASVLLPNEPYVWRVETHGSFATVDAMAGPSGFLDSFSATDDAPTGPRQGDGQYSISAGRSFTTKP